MMSCARKSNFVLTLMLVMFGQDLAIAQTIERLGEPLELDSALGVTGLEASGLTLTGDGNGLWMVNDREDLTLYWLRIEDERTEVNQESFEPRPGSGANLVERPSLEGITHPRRSGVPPAVARLAYLVDEHRNAIVPVDTHTREYGDDKMVGKMDGAEQTLPNADAYCKKCRGRSVRDCLDDAENSGLEGITYSPIHDAFFVLKQKNPGLLIKVSGDLERVLKVWALDLGDSCGRRFDIDYSGISFDSHQCRTKGRCNFWLISDQARKIYLVDLSEPRVSQISVIGMSNVVTEHKLDFRCAEGVASDPDAGVLYVVVDGEKGTSECGIPGDHSYLYRYKIRN